MTKIEINIGRQHLLFLVVFAAVLVSISYVIAIGSGDFTLHGHDSGEVEGTTPPGSVMAFAIETCPSGWISADGAAISRSTYSNLFSTIGTMYGSGDGSTTFNLPDYRGYFLRGWDQSAGVDPNSATRTDRGDGTTGDEVGTNQADEFKSHSHNAHDQTSHDGASGGSDGYTDSGNTGSAGGSETRPKNIYVLYCIKT